MSVFAISPETHYLEDHGSACYMGWKSSSGATEVEMCDLLYGLVRFIKPSLVVETGSHMGHGTMALALGVRDNGLGKVVSCEINPSFVSKAQERLKGCGWVDIRCESSLELPELRTADFVFSDSGWNTRTQEYALVKPGCVFVIHDTFHSEESEMLTRFVKDNGGTLLSFGRGCGILVKHGHN